MLIQVCHLVILEDTNIDILRDHGWKHDILITMDRKKVKYNYCGICVSRIINHFKHLARMIVDVKICMKAPKEVHQDMKNV